MLKKVLSFSLVSGLLLSLTSGCGNRLNTFPANQQFIPQQNFKSLAKRKNDLNAENLTVATYNVRNLFDGIQDPDKEPEKAKPEKELLALAKSISSLNADVIAMQEVESKSTLQKFLDKYLPGHGYQVVLVEAYDKRGIDVAVVTRLKVNNVKSHKDDKFPVPGQPEPQGFSRDLLQVSMTATTGYDFTVFVTHLKSKHGGEESDLKREAEAKRIREIISEFYAKNPEANFLLVGDFNDTHNSKPLQPILAPIRNGFKMSDLILEDLGEGEDIYTYHPQQYRARIDYLLASPGMKKEYLPKSVEIHKINEENEADKWIYFEASDHLPATARFKITADRRRTNK